MASRSLCPMSITCPTNWLLRPIRNGMEAVGRKSQQGLELMTTRDASLKHAKAILCWLAIRTVQMGMLYPNIITMREPWCLRKPFGARFYDPLFGLWLTPDPAGQFANPYTYGGDPLNYIDPNVNLGGIF